MMFLKVLHNSQENICVRDSILKSCMKIPENPTQE